MIKLNVVVSVDIGKVDVPSCPVGKPWTFHGCSIMPHWQIVDVPWMFHMLYVASYLLAMVGCMYSVMCVILLSVSLRVCG